MDIRLSFTDGRPMSRISGGPYNASVLYVFDLDAKKERIERERRKRKAVEEDDDRGYPEISMLDSSVSEIYEESKDTDNIAGMLEDISRALDSTKNKKKLVDGICDVLIQKSCTEVLGRSITLEEGNMVQIPNPYFRECIYIAGPSGSGKSWYVARYIREYHKVFPMNRVLIFNGGQDDPEFETLRKESVGPNLLFVDMKQFFV